MATKIKNHTPGPWVLGDENEYCASVVLESIGGNVTIDFDRIDINTGEILISRDEMLANCHLVMNAPKMQQRIAELERDLDAITADRDRMRSAIEYLIEMTDYIPERNCSCHISPPCSDCEEYGGLRDAITYARAALRGEKEEQL